MPSISGSMKSDGTKPRLEHVAKTRRRLDRHGFALHQQIGPGIRKYGGSNSEGDRRIRLFAGPGRGWTRLKTKQARRDIRTRAVGVALHATIEAMVGALARDGYIAMLGVIGNDESGMARSSTRSGPSADGIILTGVVADERIRARLRAAGTRVIETWGLPADPIDVAVGFSHSEVGRVVAQYFRAEAMPGPFWSRHGEPDQRAPGRFRRGMGALGWGRITGNRGRQSVALHPGSLGISIHPPAADRARRRHVRVRRPGPGLVIEAAAAGMSLPDDLAVMGFGNRSLAADMRPSITTIAIDGERLVARPQP
jgi:hypothetical protein